MGFRAGSPFPESRYAGCCKNNARDNLVPIAQNTTQKSISIVFLRKRYSHDSSLSKYRKQKQSPLEILKMAQVQVGDCVCLRYLLSDESRRITLTQKTMEMDFCVIFCGHAQHLTCERAYSGYEIALETASDELVPRLQFVKKSAQVSSVYRLRSVLICQKSSPSGHSEKSVSLNPNPRDKLIDQIPTHCPPPPPPSGLTLIGA
jgi:hypothetical protein